MGAVAGGVLFAINHHGPQEQGEEVQLIQAKKRERVDVEIPAVKFVRREPSVH